MSKQKVEVEEKENTVDIKEVPTLPGYSGLTISREPVPYTPDKLLDAYGVDQKNRPAWMIAPMSITQRNSVEADNARISSEVSLWAKEKGIDVSKFANDSSVIPKEEMQTYLTEYLAYTKMFDHFVDNDLRSEIVRTCIKGIKKKGAKEGMVFHADDEGNLTEEIFVTYDPKLISTLFDKIYNISNPNSLLTLGL